MDTPTVVKEFVIPGEMGEGCQILSNIFHGKSIRVDRAFEKLVTVGDDLSCQLFSVPKGWNDGQIIAWISRNKGINLGGIKICAVLEYLGNEGSSLLDVPEGEKEVNLILGYTTVDGVPSVFFVEHEWEQIVEEFHFHVKPMNKWNDDTTLLVLVVS
jgi:hypothetical protein